MVIFFSLLLIEVENTLLQYAKRIYFNNKDIV